MLIEFVTSKKKYVVEIWDDEPRPDWNFNEPYGEKFYVDMNEWCIESFGYHARTAYNRFEFKKEEHLTIFLLKYS